MPSRTAVSVPPWARTMPAARLLAPLPERPRLEQHDPVQPGAAQEPRAPGADRATADDDGVGACPAAETLFTSADAGID